MKILILEDEPMVSRAMAVVFRLAGGDPEWTTRVAELLALDSKPDALVIDYELREATALTIASRLDARWPGVPRVVVTSYLLDEQLARDVLAAGYLEILNKPFGVEEAKALMARLAVRSSA